MNFSRWRGWRAWTTITATLIALRATMLHIWAASGINFWTAAITSTTDRTACVVIWTNSAIRTDNISFTCPGLFFCCSYLQNFGDFSGGIAEDIIWSTWVAAWTAVQPIWAAGGTRLGTAIVCILHCCTACLSILTCAGLILTDDISHFGIIFGFELWVRFQGWLSISKGGPIALVVRSTRCARGAAFWTWTAVCIWARTATTCAACVTIRTTLPIPTRNILHYINSILRGNNSPVNTSYLEGAWD